MAVALQIELREIRTQLTRVTEHLTMPIPLAPETLRDATVAWLEAARIEMAPTLAAQVPEFWRLGAGAAGLVQIVGRLQQYNRIIDRSVELATRETAPAVTVTILPGHLLAVAARMPEAEALLLRWIV